MKIISYTTIVSVLAFAVTVVSYKCLTIHAIYFYIDIILRNRPPIVREILFYRVIGNCSKFYLPASYTIFVKILIPGDWAIYV